MDQPAAHEAAAVPGHHVAAGGMRRAVLGTLAGVALGLLVRLVVGSDGADRVPR